MKLIRFFALILISSFSSISNGEDMTIDKSKPLATVEDEHGNIYDCIDIYEQPGLDHPSLKDHKIKMKPDDEVLERLAEIRSKSSSSQVYTAPLTLKEPCPSGTIPVERKSLEMNSRSLLSSTNMTCNNPRYSSQSNSGCRKGVEFAGIYTPNKGDRYFGIGASIYVYKPTVELPHQYSSAAISIRTGYTQIQVGWTVNKKLNGDMEPRWYYQFDNEIRSGCYNSLCPGFVRTNNEIPMAGLLRPISQVGGKQYVIPFELLQERSTKHWYMFVGYAGSKTPFGYFPTEHLFRQLADGASVLQWGGYVFSNEIDLTSPQMGSGVFNNAYDRTCHFEKVVVVNNEGVMGPPKDGSISTSESRCYRVGDQSLKKDHRQYSFLFGGPGGDRQQCK